uniref:Glycoside hydrolase family 76 protein n=1 Tax=Moniliophthora roreri TaxID=221103 RepID=A0A0W0F728_MONRR
MVAAAGFWFLIGTISFCCSLVAGQFVVPLTWRKPNITTPRSERIRRAKAAIDRGLSTFSAPGGSQTINWLGVAQFCIEMADFGVLTGQETYKQTLMSYIPTAERIHPEFAYSWVRGGIAFGNAATRAYEAYKDDLFLEYAVKAWNWGRQFTISEENIEAGVIPVKKFELQRTCGNEASMAGGTFEFSTKDGTQLDSWSTGLSASLYKITANETYLLAARASASFIRSHLYMGQGVVASAILGEVENQCQLLQDTFGYSTGIVMQGLSLLRSLSSTTEYDELIRDIVIQTSSNAQWHNSDGIMIVPDYSGIYIPRGLMQVYNTTSDSSLLSYISAYLSTQYNAVVDYALGNGDIYARSWSGPSATKFDSVSQTAAISAILATVPLSNDSSATGTATVSSIFPTFSLSPSTSTAQKLPVASIVGVVVGGLVFLAAAIVSWCLVRRRLRKSRRTDITPYMNQGGEMDILLDQVDPKVHIVSDGVAVSDPMAYFVPQLGNISKPLQRE